jgi:hypothetical protein
VTIKIFVVFHKVFDPDVLATFTKTEQRDWFCAYAVNHRHQKQALIENALVDVPDEASWQACGLPPGVVFEYELPVYDPSLQDRGFMETSGYIHILENQLVADDIDHVGICQYDMRWTQQSAELVRAISAFRTPIHIGCGIDIGPILDEAGTFHEKAYADRRNWPFLIDSYNRFFGRSLTLEQLIGLPLTLFQTYILPRPDFLELAAWLRQLVSEIYPWACEPPYESHWGALGGYTERAESVFFAAKIVEAGMPYARLALDHDPGIAERLGVLKTHYREDPRP